ncbi:MAG: MBL fold metallo-hydrolase [Ignavibacteriae bacterium]|nr:MBL fold metallo-hydrolase [Ignavibacteriota bacterium]
MEIIPFECGPLATNCYLVIDNQTVGAGSESAPTIVIDAPPDAVSHLLPVIKKRNLKIEKIILTHTHWDHTLDTAELKRYTNAPVYVHKNDEYRLLKPNETSIFKLPFEIEAVVPDIYLEDGMKINCGLLEFQVLHTPGHTEGGICLVNFENNVAFTGDTIFCRSVGRTDFPGGSTDTLLSSIKNKILTLPDDMMVYSGHGEPTTIGDEKKFNPFLDEIIDFDSVVSVLSNDS